MLNSNLMEVIARDQIDVAIVYNENPCQLAFLHYLGIPYIYFDLKGFSTETKVASGTFFIPSTMDSTYSKYFQKRYLYGFQWLKEWICQSGLSPTLARLISKRYANLDEPITKLFREDYDIKRKFKQGFPDLKQNAELYFINTDIMLEPTELRYPPNVIPVGGIHIDEPWNDTIARGREGIILVTFGTQVDTEKMPEKFVKSLIFAFEKLKNFQIFWRIGPKLKLAGVENIDSLPKNVNVTTFFPQNELLANPRTRLLITNGGMHSIIEAMAYGVPILGIPLYGSNLENLEKVVHKGFGKILQKFDVNEKNLLKNTQQLIYETKYAKVAKDISKEYKNRPANAFEQAIHLIEHVARHRSAKFIRSETDNTSPLMKSFIFWNLDFFLIGLMVAFATFYIAYLALRIQFHFLSFSNEILTNILDKNTSIRNKN